MRPLRRIEKRINDFLDTVGDREFTVNNLTSSVQWDGSPKHIVRYLIKNRAVRSVGKIREGGKLLTRYKKVELTSRE